MALWRRKEIPCPTCVDQAMLPFGLTKLEGQYAINVPAVMAAGILAAARYVSPHKG